MNGIFNSSFDVDQGVESILDCSEEILEIDLLIETLKSNVPPKKSTAFKGIVEILFQHSQDLRILNHLKENVLSISLEDISNIKSDSETDDALEFLGNFFQACKLDAAEAEQVIRILSLKITSTTSKKATRKAMWCLANLQYPPEDITQYQLDMVLKAALIYLDETPPIKSVSTSCEAINVLSHLLEMSPSFVHTNLPEIIKRTFPLLFHEAVRLRQLTLQLMRPLGPVLAENRILADNFQLLEDYRSKHHATLMSWICNESVEGIHVWRWLFESWGRLLHTNHGLLNDLLKAEESALKSDSCSYRLLALQSWRWLIDCFALDQSLLVHPKRMRLILTPFTASESRTCQLAATKIDLWWYLLHRLENKAVDSFHEVTLVFLQFCFGTFDNPAGTIDLYPSLLTAAVTSLIGILSPATTYNNS